ncbi:MULTISPECIES: VOC family protein [unclassified Fusibacter]|uniref:VOC family protein n=1 Tax=unclassified Fusibacter TaxID=2624464 RepID=UPI001012CABE|nr:MULTISPECIES: VOC family protein [unclassified Fusibacter]MCK8058938.1 VOC family protein [Fusibacter sp. A2]NPE22014.1 VOC family protein [Fusibacter sp. A1]RXV61579.1 VOC family protein [Fusibacter sp. A1]
MEFVGISIITNNVPLLVDFYCKILNTRSEGDDYHAEIKTTGASLTIFCVEGMEEMAPGSMHGAGSGNFTVGVKVDQVDEAYERIKGMDIEILKLPQSYPWGTRSFWFRDPDGNIVNFFGASI